MAFGTRRALASAMRRSLDERDARDVEALSLMNATTGTARAFSRTVRDVISFGGQTKHFLHRAHEVKKFPPVAVFWGEHDELIPMAHGQRFTSFVEGAVFKSFANSGHYLHLDQPEETISALREFLDVPLMASVMLRDPRQAQRSKISVVRNVLHAFARRALSFISRKPMLER
jgi:pimeloyl-ACP methyl ester carboxylesterase